MKNALQVFDALRTRADWAVVSAFRAEFSLAENLDRHAGLLSYLGRLGLRAFHVDGRYAGADEVSALVFAVDPATARAIGRAFEQESVLTARGLEYCDGSGYLPTSGVELGSDPDNRSTVHVPGEPPLPFVSGIRWEAERIAA